MLTVTGNFTVWVRRLVALNPLVRVTDRLEAVVLVLVGLLAVLTIPLAGAIGTATYDQVSHRFAMERLARHEVEATVDADSREKPEPYEKPYVTSISWNYQGMTKNDEVRTRQLKAGDTMKIWVDVAGRRRAAVPTDSDAAAQAVVVALTVWSAVLASACAFAAFIRMRLNRSRFQEWDRELQNLADNGGKANNSTP